jgi:hypothetical protein
MRANAVMRMRKEWRGHGTGRSRKCSNDLGYVKKSSAKIEMAIAYVNDGDSVEHAAKMAGIPAEELEGYLQ